MRRTIKTILTVRMMLTSVVLGLALFLSDSCSRQEHSFTNISLTTNAVSPLQLPQHSDLAKGDEYDRAFARAAQLSQEMLKKQTNPGVALPNVEAGPGHPLPLYVNFYESDLHYPSYLLCTYDVNEFHYKQAGETNWFIASLQQLRNTGRDRFPNVDWIAVVIRNVAEHKDASTFEKSMKVGSIFKSSDVFDPSRDLLQLIADAKLDRHPFKYDPEQPLPEEEQRWMIVERHAATNVISTDSSKKTLGP